MDTVLAGDGADTINAANGVGDDTVNCAAGTDVVPGGGGDEHTNCEQSCFQE